MFLEIKSDFFLAISAVIFVVSGCATAPSNLSSSSSKVGWTIISDFDDTLKQTNCTSKRSILKNAFFTNKTFVGMQTIISGIKEIDKSSNKKTQFYILSGSPKMLLKRVKGLLKTYGYPKPQKIILRESIISSDVYSFKKKALRKLIKSAGEQILLLGDNCDADAKLFAELQLENPKLKIHAFIRSVKPISPTPMTKNYVTPLEILIHLKRNGAMEEKYALGLVGKLRIELLKSKKIIPDYAYCPSDYEPFPNPPTQPRIKKAYLDVEKKVEDFCGAR